MELLSLMQLGQQGESCPVSVLAQCPQQESSSFIEKKTAFAPPI
jgi:hypothetical protein